MLFATEPPPPPPPLRDEKFTEQQIGLWFRCREWMSQQRHPLRPLMVCELHLMHHHPARIPSALVKLTQKTVRAHFNRMYAKQATAQNKRRLNQLEAAQAENQRIRLSSVKAQADLTAMLVQSSDATRRAEAMALSAATDRDSLLLGRAPGVRGLAALRRLPHRETSSRPAEVTYPSCHPLVFSEDSLDGLDAVGQELGLDLVFGGPGV